MQNAIASSVITMANNIDARAIVAETRSGATALQISAYRSDTALIAVTSEDRTAQQLSIVYGVSGTRKLLNLVGVAQAKRLDRSVAWVVRQALIQATRRR